MNNAVPLPPRVMLNRFATPLPDDAVRCDGLSMYGNPFHWSGSIGADGNNWWVEGFGKHWPCGDRKQAMQTAKDLHSDWIKQPDQLGLRNLVRVVLVGKRPACWCKPDDPCHCDTLAAVAVTPKEGA